jgi:anaerobic selenocysteine-containing dehydrogenase
MTLDKLAGRGIRWPEAGGLDVKAWKPVKLKVPKAAPAASSGSLRLGTFRTLWASKEVDISPALAFARPSPVVELSPADAERIGVGHGDEVEVGTNGTRLRGRAVVRAAIPAGTVWVPEGVGSVTLTEALVEVRLREPEGAPVADAETAEPAGDANAGEPAEVASGAAHAGPDTDAHPAETGTGTAPS